MNVILIDSDLRFNVEEIKRALLKCDIKDDDIFVHTFKSNNTKEDIKQYLANKNGFLICQAELFTGMEADAVVYCVSDGINKNVRVNVMRACSKLNIIYAYKKHYGDFTDFSSAKLDPSFMSGCDEVFSNYPLKCIKCEKKENKIDNDKEDKDDVIVCKLCW